MTQRRRSDPVAWLAAPAALYFLGAIGAPLALLLFGSLKAPDGLGLGNYLKVLGDGHQRDVIIATLRYAAMVTLGALGFGYAYAYAMATTGPRMRATLLVAIVLPMTTSIIVKTFGWTLILRSNGPINATLMGAGLIDAPVRLLFTETGLLLGSVAILMPYMVLPIFAALRQIPLEQLDAAATLGAGPAYRFWKVILPLSSPGIVAGAAIVFSMAISAYVIPSLLTGAGYKTMSKVIANAFLVIHNPALGSTVGVMLLFLSGAVVLIGGAAAARMGKG